MGKIIRPTYPAEFTVGLLLLIFALSFFLSSQVFLVSWRELMEGTTNAYVGMFLASAAVVIMVLILWEEFFFPVKVKQTDDVVVYRNHGTKLKTQLLIYLAIPAIFVFIYLEFKVNIVRFSVWAAICMILPVVGRLVSGIKNYNDFLKLTNDFIQYKNNEKVGTFQVKEISQLRLIRDERTVLHKIGVISTNGSEVIIDLDEMELEAFLGAIDQYVTAHYKTLIRSVQPATK